MTEYQRTHIELKKQFVATNEGLDSTCALYIPKEELEQSEDQQAKGVLVDVYDLLDFKKGAYELLCQIGNCSDKKTFKRLGTLKDYADNWGNHYALPKPKTPEEKQREKERQAQLGLSTSRYHPNPLETGVLEESTGGAVCDCCGKTTHIFYINPFFPVEDIAYLCPECIANGEAVRKYDGSFQDDSSVDDGVDDPEKLGELIHRTSGYPGWQQEYWHAHRGGYCAYLGNTGARGLQVLGVLEEVLDDPMWNEEQKGMIRESVNGGHLQRYLFQYLHCGKHLVRMDFDWGGNMKKKDFPKGTKPREILAYTCGRVVEPLIPLGYKHRKSKNDIYRKDGIFVFFFYFLLSIRFGSTTFTAFSDVSSPVIAQWRSEQEGTEETYDSIVGTSIARLTYRYDDFSHYEVSTLLERKRPIQEISGQIQDYVLSSFVRPSNLPRPLDDVEQEGFFPRRKGFDVPKRNREFTECFREYLQKQ